MTHTLQEKEYLGDGVYIGHDGYQLVVYVEGGSAFGPGAVALEGPVLEALDRYRARVFTEPTGEFKRGLDTAAEICDNCDACEQGACACSMLAQQIRALKEPKK